MARDGRETLVPVGVWREICPTWWVSPWRDARRRRRGGAFAAAGRGSGASSYTSRSGQKGTSVTVYSLNKLLSGPLGRVMGKEFVSPP